MTEQTITSIEQIQDLVLAGETNWSRYGLVKVKQFGRFLIFNYTHECQKAAVWNYFERVSRGLILDAVTAEIVARPFAKFFNYGERDRFYPDPDAKIVNITNKMDGSLGLVFRNNGYKIATRGSLESEQAIWATKFLNERYNLTGLPEDLTLLLEIIYPENRIVVDYDLREDLVLLAVINRKTGVEPPFDGNISVTSIAHHFGFNLPVTYQFNTVDDILKWAKAINGFETEGCVLRYSDGTRYKVKGDDYFLKHRIISNITFKNVFEAYINNKADDYFSVIPDEFMAEIDNWLSSIKDTLASVDWWVKDVFLLLPKGSRKEFALSIKDTSYKSLYFALFDGKENKYRDTLNKMVYKILEKEFG